MPPPPAMHGGGDHWAGDTFDSASGGNITSGGWNSTDLFFSLINLDGLFGLTQEIGYSGFNSVLDAIEAGFIRNISTGEWGTIFNRAFTDTRFQRACEVAIAYGSNGAVVAEDRGCIPAAPIPSELIFLGLLSFLIIYSYHNRGEFLNLNILKNQVNSLIKN